MKAIKVKRSDETISTKNSNTNKKNKGINLKSVIKLHDYLIYMIN